MRVLVGLSGGVDSSVTACLLKEKGYEVIGATMSIWDKEKYKNVFQGHKGDACFSPHEEEDIKTCQSLCEKIGIEYHVIDCTKEYQKLVLANFKSEYLKGRTPNPCVVCNSNIKFEALPRGAKALGLAFDKFATGHYVRLSQNATSGRYMLQSAVDLPKDQSYFLYRLTQEQLSKILTPLGDYTKEEVREIARKYGLEVSDKKDSQDFYLGDINDIIDEPDKVGNFVDTSGKILGHHNGIWHFTIGQRRGLGVSADRPLYVVALNKEKNEVVLGYSEENFKSSLMVSNLNWVCVENINEKKNVLLKLRSSQKPFEATFEPLETKAKLIFSEPQKAVATGQSAVFYDEQGFVLGGGVIESTE